MRSTLSILFFQTNSGIKKGQEIICNFATQNLIQISTASNMFQGSGVKLKITFPNYFKNLERMFDNLGHCKICLLPAGIELGCREHAGDLFFWFYNMYFSVRLYCICQILFLRQFDNLRHCKISLLSGWMHCAVDIGQMKYGQII